jgi:hypothetical protein
MLSILGLASYEQKYVHNFATFEIVFRNQVVLDAKPITWNVIANEAFVSIKYLIANKMG